MRIARRGSHRGAGNFFPNSTPDRFAQALFSSEQNYLAKIGLTIDLPNARQFAASIGLVPRQYSTGGKPTLLGISKRGDKNLRRLLVQGARVIMQRIQTRADVLGEWVRDMLCRRHSNVVACALANKMARIAWALLAKGTHYQSRSAVAAA